MTTRANEAKTPPREARLKLSPVPSRPPASGLSEQCRAVSEANRPVQRSEGRRRVKAGE